MKRRTFWTTAGLLLLVGVGFWFYENASLPRLRRDFRPWMERLVRYRDAAEAARRSLISRNATPADPKGIEEVRAWAWKDLERIGYAEYRVEKPEIELRGGDETIVGRLVLTVGGFGADGSRVEKAARVIVKVEGRPSPLPSPAGRGGGSLGGGSGVGASVQLEQALWSRIESSPRFHDATAEAGLGAPRHDPPFKLTNWLIGDIWPGSGVAVLDYNRDGFEDLFVGDGVRSLLYENDGRGHFTDVTVKAGLAATATQGIPATGVAAADVDADGFPDLFVTDAFGPARLFRNKGDGTFEETTDRSGIALSGNMRSAAFADADGDGDLDLFVCVTGDYYRQMPDPPFDANDARPNHFYVNDGHGHFTDATEAWGLGKLSRWSLSSLFADYDGDGRVDLLVTNDFGLKNLYRNGGDRRFVDVTKKAGVEARAYGMSGAWGDFDGDGLLDLYTTGTDTQWYFLHEYPSMPVGLPGRIFLPIAVEWMEKMSTGNSLFLQRTDHTFDDATARSGAAHAGWDWSAVAADLDNDSRPDLYATNGMWGDGRDHDSELEFWWDSLAYWDDYVAGKRAFDRKGAGIAGIERDRYFHNRGAAPLFEDRAFLDGLDLETNGRAAVVFDANGDGALDVYVRSVEAPEAIFFGRRGTQEHFLRLRLAGTPGKDNRDGVGARVVATLPGGRRITIETDNPSGYLSTASPIAHLGLGGATRLTALSVRWPSGRVQELGPVNTVDRTLVVDEERGIVPGATRRP